MRRPLGILEYAEALTNAHYPFNVVAVVRLSGAPRPETLERAFALLRGHHPLLAARIHEVDGYPAFDTGVVPPTPFRVLQRGPEEEWTALAEEELNTAFDLATGPLARLAYFAPAGAEREAEIVLTLQHAIVDADSGVQLVRELLTLCAQLEAGGAEPETAPMPFPPAAESRFPARFRGWRGASRQAAFVLRQMAEEAAFQWRSRGKRQPPVHPAGRVRILPMQLPAPATAALVQRCRHRRVTVNSALCAAMLRVVQRRLYGGVGQPLRNFVIANLRPYLDPPLEADNLGSHFAMMRFTNQVSRDGDFWELAGEINRQVYRAAKRGEKYLNLLMTRALMKMMLGLKRMRMAHTALSYTGVADIPPDYGPIRITGLHGFVSNFPIGPEYAAQVNLFDGRLWWDIVYLDCDMDGRTARELAQEIFAELEVQADAAHT